MPVHKQVDLVFVEKRFIDKPGGRYNFVNKFDCFKNFSSLIET